MPVIKNPYLSKVTIENFRNFLATSVELDHKQVIIGENNVGKTNFLRAIQLVLDPGFSDNDRTLLDSDFHDSLDTPMEQGEEIRIELEIRGYEHNPKLVAQFADAVVAIDPPTLRFTYLFRPTRDEKKAIIRYDYLIFKGNKEEYLFKNEDRSYINIYVIKALRDVERELKSNRQSPLYKLVRKYEIAQDKLKTISEKLQLAAEEILELDEIVHIKNTLQKRFDTLSGLQKDNEINLRTFDIDTERLLYNLQVYMGVAERPVSEMSLGLANILYVSLMLILIQDHTVTPVIKPERFAELAHLDTNDLLNELYAQSNQGNYVLNTGISAQKARALYEFMAEYNYSHQAFTILAVEEPEAHLHPVLQRLLYREILHKSSTSVIFTSHSTFIASVAPLNTIVHIRPENDASEVFSTVGVPLSGRERKDIERYIDAKRGELYFGKGVILTEGITEEYLVPAAAQLLGTPLDDHGIIVCNINSTNFRPYVQLLDALQIPWAIFTDGDYYNLDGTERKYHEMDDGGDGGLRGHEQLSSLLVDLDYVEEDALEEEDVDLLEIFEENGCFVGYYTLEVDMMKDGGDEAIAAFKTAYGELITGGPAMKANFDTAIADGDYWAALKKIENNISKGRFAQRLVSHLTENMIPDYIRDGIEYMVDIVKDDE